MATTVFTSVSSSNHKSMNLGDIAYRSMSNSFPSTKLFAGQSSYNWPKNGNGRSGLSLKSPRAEKSPYDRIPEQFRQENLKEGLMENYKNAPQALYGLSPSQLKLFMRADNPYSKLASATTKESISSATRYSQIVMGSSTQTMGSLNTSAFGGGGQSYGRGRGGRSPPPPDLPSLILDCRIVFIGMPLVTEVAELLVAQIMWLNFDDDTKPIHLYIYSTGTLDEESQEIVATENDAYTVADAVLLSRAPVYSLNLGIADGQAAVLLSLGEKGFRALMPHCSTKLHLPKLYKSSGPVSDMSIKHEDHEVNVDYFLELLSQGTGKSREQLASELEFPRYLSAEAAIEFGIADKILDPNDGGKFAELTLRSRGSGGARSQPVNPEFLFGTN